METFATFVASKIETSTLMANSTQAAASEASMAFDIDPNNAQSHRQGKQYEAAQRSQAIVESIEDEEDEDD